MPIYDYQCVVCGGWDQRVAGLDDHTAICTHMLETQQGLQACGGLMLRLDEDFFRPYFEELGVEMEERR